MAFIDDFLDFMPDTLTVQPGVNNEFGEWTPSGASFAVPCRIEGANRLFRDAQGREVAATTQLYCGGVYGLTVEFHRYYLPSDYLPSGARVAVAVFPEHDEDGPAFDVVYF